ncbi:MAG: Holliday junction resolvase RecU [Pigeon pea little leaf phytoplasma]|uniref:Holliday junction resolvase RecU n=1 Tax=Candidatus Phytoplasma fabacearum TaxID=2982628 RepID=A0ABU8ZTK8_9MOLU|nr:Holliday junction resolvase RecU ['Bituminaria bituminosa' little leaf phytoplasma]MDV3148950.1 Holliday junction resolvase RecU [Pigeon pea little leaf phytoplasma]MDO7983772.1 Holliday junction resolvase RecU ['Bituminaria bituminosa' little leaf phytoplasma]MDO8024087.1 Holliday junction resolvase RecU ['Bituminaria bituminosa' little leaf phytoplasma]MDO8030488.1 Holliday junction resolvase RecU ['Bituminaria bituminosa' little leaf phytoplasma]MDV3154200.1 Holliday junction resolvase R
MKYPAKINNQNLNYNKKSNLGKQLEQDINLTNKFYQENQIAFINKNEIPIQVVKVEYAQRNKTKIIEAYYRLKSLPDYQGIYKGKYLSFDAKETNNLNKFPLKNIPNHQIICLQKIHELKGIAFLIIHFKRYNQYFYLPISFLINFKKQYSSKSIDYQTFINELWQIPYNYRPRLDYLQIVNKFL